MYVSHVMKENADAIYEWLVGRGGCVVISGCAYIRGACARHTDPWRRETPLLFFTVLFTAKGIRRQYLRPRRSR